MSILSETAKWRVLPADNQPDWPDLSALRENAAIIADLPPLVTFSKIHRLRSRLALAAQGRAFLLQGGDCAETFAGATRPHIRRQIDTLTEMANMISTKTSVPVVKVARIAGQYAKPRSTIRDAEGLRLYRGDMVNSVLANHEARCPDPTRLLTAYTTAAATLAELRSISKAERASNGRNATDEIYTSHEGLILDYEAALTRARGGEEVDLSAHFLWIGERTRQLGGAHVEFFSHVANPVGVKIGPSVTPDIVVALAERLNPHAEPGKLTLITRMGRDRIRHVLPEILQRVAATGIPVIWQCDPMHGNSKMTSAGLRTRHFEHIVDEAHGFFEAHRFAGTYPGGIHLELTGDDVTECIGGGQGITEARLSERYTTACDPRLNANQSAEFADVLGELISDFRGAVPSQRSA